MQTLASGYRSISFLVRLHSDHFLTLAMIGIGLVVGAFLGSAISAL